MTDMTGRKNFKVFNQDFIVDERYNVTKELGQGAYGIVWYVWHLRLDLENLAHDTFARDVGPGLDTGFQKGANVLLK
jgi:hypothetical protein